MVALPEQKNLTRDAIYAAYVRNRETYRGKRIGAGIIGNECERDIWYSFRWATEEYLDGQKLRLFETGHLEEPRVLENLRQAGIEVRSIDPETGRQYFAQDDTGHFGGLVDGIGIGVLEAPCTEHNVEIKTHNDKSFKDLLKKGVAESKPAHLAQMQSCMHLMDLPRSLYVAVNKNTDEIYCERIKYDVTHALSLVAKAHRIIGAKVPPARPFKSDFYLCKMCKHRGYCHDGGKPERNCRTCMHSTPADGGRWICELHNCEIPHLEQQKHHPCHRYIPALVPLRQIDVDGTAIVYEGWVDDGQ